MKTTTLGEDPSLKKEMIVLGRKITYSKAGIKYEADPKHIEQLVKEMF